VPSQLFSLASRKAPAVARGTSLKQPAEVWLSPRAEVGQYGVVLFEQPRRLEMLTEAIAFLPPLALRQAAALGQ